MQSSAIAAGECDTGLCIVMYCYVLSALVVTLSVVNHRFFYLAANVHDLYNQASLETYGSLLLLAVIPIAAILGALVKAHYEGPSCPSSAKLEGRS